MTNMLKSYSLVYWPHPALAQTSTTLLPHEISSEETKNLVAWMFEIMHKTRGIGLAANQVGVTQRVIIADLSYLGENALITGFTKPKVFINPEIISHIGFSELEEGCLSFPDITMKIRRCEKISVKAFGVDGQEFIEEAAGLYAHVLQHEIEHLNGKTIYDHMSNLRRDIVKRKMKKLK